MLNLSDIREKIVYISQQAYLFPGTILENLRPADPQANADQIWEALVKAGMEEYVSTLPEGLQTMLSEKGDNLSGGQRQRLSLARAFLRKAAVYIFDEPTASLDPDMEGKVIESIMTLVKRLRDDLNKIPYIYTETVFRLLLGVFYGGGSLLIMLRFCWQLSIVVIVLCVFESYLVAILSKEIERKTELLQKTVDEKQQIIFDLIRNLRFIKIFSNKSVEAYP